MDSLDLKILAALAEFGRITWTDLASELGLSPPGAADRVRRLEERGIIEGYTALIAPPMVQASLLAFVSVSLSHPKFQKKFVDAVLGLDAVQECHRIAGDHDYLLKIRTGSTKQLESLLAGEIQPLGGVARVQTTVALSSVKETPVPPIPAQPWTD